VLLIVLILIFALLFPPTPSDARLKTHVVPMTNALEKIEHIRGVSYEWNKAAVMVGRWPGQNDIGVLAQEVESVVPEAVTTGLDGYKRVDYSKLTPTLIEAVKELKAEVDALKADNEALRQQLNALQPSPNKK
jgi:hypothetical protein